MEKLVRKIFIFAGMILFLSIVGCQNPEFPSPQICISGECDAKMLVPGELDENGYYHVKLNWNTDFMPYFSMDIVATEVIPEYRYNRISVVSAEFDSDTFWTLDGVAWQEPLYNPFTSDVSSSGTWLPTEVTELTIDYFEGVDINIAQGTEVYFSKKNDVFYTKRTIGPFPPELKGDTVTVFMEVFWDAGNHSVLKNDFFTKIIVE